MKKNYFFTLLLLFCLSNIALAQGLEPFTNSTATSTYADGSFEGENGITWSFTASRDANNDANESGITLPALLLRRASDDSKVSSSTISGGIGNFSVKLYKGFTGAGNRQVELFINGVSRGSSIPFDDFEEHIFTVSGINIIGDFTLEIRNATSRQVIIDDVTWTVPSSDPSLSIVTPANNTVYQSTTTQVPLNFNIANFRLSADDGNGMSDNSGDGYIKATIEETGQQTSVISFFDANPTLSVVSGRTYIVTTELVNNSGASLSPKVEDAVTFSVRLPCDIQLGSVETSCNASTNGNDTYSISIPFTGGNTSNYTLNTDSGTIGGDDPSTNASGTITISGVAENTNVEFTLSGDAAISSCNLTRNITSPICIPAPTCPAEGALFITEIMQNPAFVGDSEGEYFEIYNASDTAIDLQGWVIATASTGNPVTTVISSSLIVPSKGYAVLGENADITTNGGVTVNYQYDSGLFLGNSTATITLTCGTIIIDEVTYDGGATFPNPTGKSMELATNKYSATDNNIGTNWAEATVEIISGGDLGTPGTTNSFVLSIAKNNILGFATYPNPVTNNRFTITSNSSIKKQITIYNVLGKKVFSTTISGSKNTVDVNDISAGLYILKVTEGAKTATSKLVIK